MIGLRQTLLSRNTTFILNNPNIPNDYFVEEAASTRRILPVEGPAGRFIWISALSFDIILFNETPDPEQLESPTS